MVTLLQSLELCNVGVNEIFFGNSLVFNRPN